MNLGKEKEGEEMNLGKEEKVIIYGDVLESILSKVPLVELASACSLVSREWKAAVSSSLRHLNPAKPWLFIHTQATRTPYSTSTRAYDPRSRTWVRIHRPCIKHVSTLRSAHSTLLYMLSPSRLSFSSDPFHLTWHHADSPFVWRTDPIVALLGTKLIVAGGGCDFEDDPLAVEIYDLTTKTWDSCEFMPAVLKDSSASTCLSVATDDRGGGRFMFVVQRQFGIMHTFDSDSNIWTGPFDIRPVPSFDHQILAVLHVTFLNGRLILIGLIMSENKKKKKKKVLALKVWWVDPESLEREEIGEMPKELLMLENEMHWSSSSTSASSSGNCVFIYNNNNNNNNNSPIAGAGVVYVCEVLLLAKENGGGRCRWSREEIPMMITEKKEDNNNNKRVVFTCSQVTISHLNLALRSPNWKISIN